MRFSQDEIKNITMKHLFSLFILIGRSFVRCFNVRTLSHLQEIVMKTQPATRCIYALAFLLSLACPARASFEFETSPAPAYYSLSAEYSAFINSVIVETNGPITWNGGSLTATVTSNSVTGADHIGIRSGGQLSIENIGGSVNIKYGGVTFATASGFIPGSNVTSGSSFVCNFQGNPTSTAVQALLYALIFKRDGFGYSIYETNIFAAFSICGVNVTLTDGNGFAASLVREVNFPKVTGLRFVPPILFALSDAGERTGDVTTFADFDSGAQLARIRPQLTYEIDLPGATIHQGDTPHSVYLVLPASTSTFIPYSVSATAPASAAAIEKTHEPGHMKNSSCVSLFAPNLRLCFSMAMGYSPTFCKPEDEPGSPLTGLAASAASVTPEISIPSYRALESLMKLTSAGNRLSGIYRQHSPEMLRIACRYQHLIPQCQNIFISWQPFVSEFLAGRGTNVITSAMVNSLNAVWDQFISYASPTLKTNLTTERARFNNFQDFTNKTFNQWAQMLDISVPTNSYVFLSEATPTTNGHFTAQANYAAGASYSLQRSLNLSNWSPVTSLQLQTNSNLSIRITDTNPPPTNTFYRAVVQP
jgi:hypothetical protein